MDEKQNKFLTEGLIIGYISILGYLTAFAYGYGYLSFFNIPSSFIQINLTTILISISAIASGMFLVFLIIQLLSMTGIFYLKGAFGASVKRGIIWVILFLGYIIMSNFRNIIPIIIISLIMLFLEFGFPLIIHRKQKTTESKFLAQEETERHVNENDLILNLMKKYRGILNYFFVGMLIISFSIIRGESKAQSQTDFLIPDNRSNIVIIEAYGNMHIGLEFDESTHFTKNRFIIISDEQLGTLTLTKVGKLKPTDIK